ncbi:MAG: glycosyltransferase family 4 protein [Opitutales bacterium]|nr:glycosyltransferase family 4 protein [Opitutales bacterium]
MVPCGGAEVTVSFAATNPCHVYDLAVALRALGVGGMYYSGYPRWRLRPPPGFAMRAASFRTLVTYGLQRLPERWRPPNPRLFQWQDTGFDRRVARMLEPVDFIHGLPGQCLRTFQESRKLGVRTVLNHASGPLRQQLALIEPEYARAGLEPPLREDRSADLLRRIDAEMELADFHCVASTVVREQLLREGVAEDRIWVVPYGADPARFPKSGRIPDGPFRICFAGQLSLRKGIHYLLKALEAAGRSDWEARFFGPPMAETEGDFAAYGGSVPLRRMGAVSQADLGRAFAEASLLVLPSAEEAFGLVVVQALEAGVPCVVSDRVGAKDLVRHRENGSVVPFGDVGALAQELLWWAGNPRRVPDHYGWEPCAGELRRVSARAAVGAV